MHGDGLLSSGFASAVNFGIYGILAAYKCSNFGTLLYQQFKSFTVGFGSAFEDDFAAQFGVQVFLGPQIIVDNARIGFAIPRHRAHVFVHQFGAAVSFFVSLCISLGIFYPTEGTFAFLDEIFHLFGTHYFFDHFTIVADEKQGRIGRNGVGFLKFFPLWLFHVNLHADEVFIKKSAHISMGKHVFGHHFAGAAPSGVGVYKNGFFLLFGFSQGFYPGAVEKLNALRRYKTDQGEKNDQSGAYLLHWNDF